MSSASVLPCKLTVFRVSLALDSYPSSPGTGTGTGTGGGSCDSGTVGTGDVGAGANGGADARSVFAAGGKVSSVSSISKLMCEPSNAD